MHLHLHVNVIDRRSPFADRIVTWWRARRGPTENILINQDWSMDRICRRVRECVTGAARPNRETGLGVLRLFCHGGPGFVQLGNGFYRQSIESFRLLDGWFVGRYPKIEVHACSVLEGESVEGRALMQRLANMAQVLVIAGYDVQRVDGEMAFEGTVGHFRPMRRG